MMVFCHPAGSIAAAQDPVQHEILCLAFGSHRMTE
jgi:hypothetical protein